MAIVSSWSSGEGHPAHDIMVADHLDRHYIQWRSAPSLKLFLFFFAFFAGGARGELLV